MKKTTYMFFAMSLIVLTGNRVSAHQLSVPLHNKHVIALQAAGEPSEPAEPSEPPAAPGVPDGPGGPDGGPDGQGEGGPGQ